MRADFVFAKAKKCGDGSSNCSRSSGELAMEKSFCTRMVQGSVRKYQWIQ